MNKIFIALAACMLLSPTTINAHSFHDPFGLNASIIIYNTGKTPLYTPGKTMQGGRPFGNPIDWRRRGGLIIQPGKSRRIDNISPGTYEIYSTHTPKWPVSDSALFGTWYKTTEVFRRGHTTHVGR